MVTKDNLVAYRDFLIKIIGCLKDAPDPLATYGPHWWAAVVAQHEQKDLLDAVLFSTAELPLFRPAEDVLPDFVFPTAHHAAVGIIERTKEIYRLFEDPDQIPDNTPTIAEMMTHASYNWPGWGEDESSVDWDEIMRRVNRDMMNRHVDPDSRIRWRFGEMEARIQKECALAIKGLSELSPERPQVECDSPRETVRLRKSELAATKKKKDPAPIFSETVRTVKDRFARDGLYWKEPTVQEVELRASDLAAR